MSDRFGFLGDAMEVERQDFSADRKGMGPSSVSCSICLEFVGADFGERSVAKLQCGHEFHLDCIGSAFNAKGAMQCPNCRKIEKGRWLYANGCHSFADFNEDELVNEDLYDLSYSEMPFGFQWCPFRGFAQLASTFEEGEPQPNAYHDLLRSASFGDMSASSSSSTHVCPYLALHGFHHAMHPAPSNAVDTLPDVGLFHQHHPGLGGPSSGDVMNSHNFSATGPQHHNRGQTSIPFSVPGNGDQSASQVAPRLPRDSGGHQRLGSFSHPHHFHHGSVARNGGNLIASLGLPVMGDARGHSRVHGSHVFQQSASSSSSIRNGRFPPIRRRMRPRRLALISSAAATTSSSEIGGFYGFSVAGSVSRSYQGGQNIGRHFDRSYGWRRAGFTPLPWIPVEGESQWWRPFHPNQNPQSGSAESMSGNYFPRTQRGGAERVTQRVPLPRMPPFM